MQQGGFLGDDVREWIKCHVIQGYRNRPQDYFVMRQEPRTCPSYVFDSPTGSLKFYRVQHKRETMPCKKKRAFTEKTV